jgi:hypothetical protein
MSLKGEPASAHILPRHFYLLLSSLGCARKTALKYLAELVLSDFKLLVSSCVFVE